MTDVGKVNIRCFDRQNYWEYLSSETPKENNPFTEQIYLFTTESLYPLLTTLILSGGANRLVKLLLKRSSRTVWLSDGNCKLLGIEPDYHPELKNEV